MRTSRRARIGWIAGVLCGAWLTAVSCRHVRSSGEADAGSMTIVRSEFIAEVPPTPSAHASTIVETSSGLVAAWFGGTREGATDVAIWMSHLDRGAWSAPVEVAVGRSASGARRACYNPVLFMSADGVLHLFYKVGTQPATWWGMHSTSRDDGRTWSTPTRLPDGILGPVKNKPMLLADGTIISGSSTESIDENPVWRVHFEVSHDNGETWSVVSPARADGVEVQAIQPSILRHRDGALQAIGRSRSGRLFETWSQDDGNTWSAVSLTDVPNPNAGTDAVTLRDGRQLLVYNPTTTARTPLSVAVSADGRTWRDVAVLEDMAGEYSYPAVIQSRDGLVHVTYTWRRQRIRHVVIDPRR